MSNGCPTCGTSDFTKHFPGCAYRRDGEVPLARGEFISRFKTALKKELGESYDAKYVDQIAPTYYDEQFLVDGIDPETCAEAEASEWGEE